MKFYHNNERQEVEPVKGYIIYGGGAILYQTTREPEPQTTKLTKEGEPQLSPIYGEDLEAINLLQPIKRANKENLTRKDNYKLFVHGKYSFDSGYMIYLHISEFGAVEPLGDVLSLQTEEEKNYLKACRVSFRDITIKESKLERLPYDPQFTPPEGCSWSDGYGTKEKPRFSVFEGFNMHGHEKKPAILKKWIEYNSYNNFTCIFTEPYYSKTIKTEDRKRKERLAALINEKCPLYGYKLSHYDITKLEQYFIITEKAEV